MHYLAVILTFFVLYTATTLAQDSERAILAAPAFWCPYACDTQSEKLGFAVEIALAAFASQNIHVHYRNIPYVRIQMELMSGNIDGIVGSFKEESVGAIFPDKPVLTSYFCFYSYAELDFQWSGDVTALERFNLLVTGGYTYTPEIDAYIAGLPDRVNPLKGQDISYRGFTMLEQNRADLFLDEARLYAYTLKQGLIKKARNLGCLSDYSEGYVAFSPRDPERSLALARAYDKGFHEIEKSGRLQAIIEDYGFSSFYVPAEIKSQNSSTGQKPID